MLITCFLVGCASNSAKIESEIVSRPAVEQRALTSAMETAFSYVDFTVFTNA